MLRIYLFMSNYFYYFTNFTQYILVYSNKISYNNSIIWGLFNKWGFKNLSNIYEVFGLGF